MLYFAVYAEDTRNHLLTVTPSALSLEMDLCPLIAHILMRLAFEVPAKHII